MAVVARWYCLSKDGVATLCADERDAISVALEADELYPRSAPHLATQMMPLSQWREILKNAGFF